MKNLIIIGKAVKKLWRNLWIGYKVFAIASALILGSETAFVIYAKFETARLVEQAKADHQEYINMVNKYKGD